MKQGRQVPIKPIRRLVERWCADHPDVRELVGPLAAGICLGNTGIIASLTGVSEDTVNSVRFNEKKKFISYVNAEAIVEGLYGPHEWNFDPELYAIYEAAA